MAIPEPSSWRNWVRHDDQGRTIIINVGRVCHARTNWKRSVRWSDATAAIGFPALRVHDLRHTAASIWLGAGADPKVVQRVLGHASAAMTMDLYGHMIDNNLWTAAKRLGGSTGTGSGVVSELHRRGSDGAGP